MMLTANSIEDNKKNILEIRNTSWKKKKKYLDG